MKNQQIDNNVPPSPEDVIRHDAAVSALFAHLDNHHVRLEDFGCYVALSEDRKTIFDCPMMADGSPDRYEFDLHHMNWGEVTAPEPEFVNKVNELFGTSFVWESFSGR